MATGAPDGDERERLIVGAMPLVGQIARRFPPSPVLDRDDLVSAGMMGLVLAARRWDPDWGVPFGAYASHRIRGAIQDERRRLRPGTRHDPQPPARSLDQALAGLGSGAKDLTLADRCADPLAQAAFDQVEARADLAPELDRLPARERRVVVDVYRRDRPVRDLADDLGVSESRISQIHHRALGRLRDQLTHSGAA